MKKMFKDNLWKVIISSVLTLIPAIVALCISDFVGSNMGSVDSATAKSFFLDLAFWVTPIMLVVHLGGIAITFWDNGKREQSTKLFSLMFWIVPTINAYAFVICLSLALGTEINVINLTMIMFGLLFTIMGNYMPKVKQNFTMGIKIRWTLANSENWNATHRVAGWTWFGCGILCLIAGVLPLYEIGIWFMISITVVAGAVPILFSYFFFQKQLKEGRASLEELESLTNNPSIKNVKYIAITILVIVMVFISIISFFGDVEVEYGDDSFNVSATFSNKTTVNADEIETIIYDETDTVGSRVFGFASARLLTGLFNNKEYGSYTRYSYVGSKSAVVIRLTDKSIIVINGEDDSATQAIYSELVSKYQPAN